MEFSLNVNSMEQIELIIINQYDNMYCKIEKKIILIIFYKKNWHVDLL